MTKVKLSKRFMGICLLLNSAYLLAAETCYQTADELVKATAVSVDGQRVEVDLNGDKVNEYVYSTNCGARQCYSTVVMKVDGCFLNVLSIQGDISFIDSLPIFVTDNVKDLDYAEEKAKVYGYKFISHYSYDCSGHSRAKTLFAYNKKKKAYEEIYQESFNLCKLLN